MIQLDYYSVIKHWSEKNQNRFYGVTQWINKTLLYAIPIFFQFEIQFTSPRAAPSGDPSAKWLLPEIGFGRNEPRDTTNDFHWFKVWSLWVDWLGIFVGIGLCVKCAKP